MKQRNKRPQKVAEVQQDKEEVKDVAPQQQGFLDRILPRPMAGMNTKFNLY
jgi:hypothetical protein